MAYDTARNRDGHDPVLLAVDERGVMFSRVEDMRPAPRAFPRRFLSGRQRLMRVPINILAVRAELELKVMPPTLGILRFHGVAVPAGNHI